MNPLFSFFAGGLALGWGILILLGAIVIELVCFSSSGSVFWRWLERVFAMVAAVLILSASPPVASWLLGVWIIIFILWRLESNSGFLFSLDLRWPVIAVFVVLNLVLGFNALISYLPPEGVKNKPEKVVVFGDSLTAGIPGDGTEKQWPEIVEEKTGIKFKSHSRGGARVEYVVRKLIKMDLDSSQNTIYLILIGGNDILGKTTPEKYERDLEKMYSLLNFGSVIYSFEIPLPPFSSDLALIQRKVAARHGVRLIPRRYLASLLGTSRYTMDGVHLSTAGHRRLAEIVIELLFEGVNLEGQIL
jgi:acyl-CoA thioesterase-1